MITAYFAKVILCSGLLFGYYMLALRNKRFHEWNRYYLLLLPVVSMVIPLLKIPLPMESATTTPSIVYTYTYQVATIQAKLAGAQSHTFTLPQVLTAIYILIATLLLGKLTFTSLKILRLARKNAATKTPDYTLITLNNPGSPFSFFSFIFWSNQLPIDDQKGRQMLQHEIVHVRQKHSLDKLYMITINALGWINPFFYLTRQELSLVHEFIADKHAAGLEISDYAETILQSVFQSRAFKISNDFLFPPIKRRIIMLTSFQKDRFSYLRRIMVLPVSAIIFCSFAFVAAANPAPFSNHAPTITQVLAQEPRVTVIGYASPADTSKPPKPKVVNAGAPAFPGGANELNKFLAKTVRYPKDAQTNNVQGVVIAAFTVEADGSLTHITTTNKTKLGNGLEEEAIRVVKAMPRWIPAERNGKKVAEQASFPIRFTIQDDAKDNAKTTETSQRSRENPEVFTFVDLPPSFVGGENALNKYLSHNIRYPKEAQEKKITGTVFIQFIVTAEGKILGVKSVGSPKGGGLEEEAIRVVKEMPDWIPGRQGGRKVNVQFNLPIRFVLESKS